MNSMVRKLGFVLLIAGAMGTQVAMENEADQGREIMAHDFYSFMHEANKACNDYIFAMRFNPYYRDSLSEEAKSEAEAFADEMCHHLHFLENGSFHAGLHLTPEQHDFMDEIIYDESTGYYVEPCTRRKFYHLPFGYEEFDLQQNDDSNDGSSDESSEDGSDEEGPAMATAWTRVQNTCFALNARQVQRFEALQAMTAIVKEKLQHAPVDEITRCRQRLVGESIDSFQRGVIDKAVESVNNEVEGHKTLSALFDREMVNNISAIRGRMPNAQKYEAEWLEKKAQEGLCLYDLRHVCENYSQLAKLVQYCIDNKQLLSPSDVELLDKIVANKLVSDELLQESKIIKGFVDCNPDKQYRSTGLLSVWRTWVGRCVGLRDMIKNILNTLVEQSKGKEEAE